MGIGGLRRFFRDVRHENATWELSRMGANRGNMGRMKTLIRFMHEVSQGHPRMVGPPMPGTSPNKCGLRLRLRAVWVRSCWPEKEGDRASQGRGVPCHYIPLPFPQLRLHGIMGLRALKSCWSPGSGSGVQTFKPSHPVPTRRIQNRSQSFRFEWAELFIVVLLPGPPLPTGSSGPPLSLPRPSSGPKRRI